MALRDIPCYVKVILQKGFGECLAGIRLPEVNAGAAVLIELDMRP